MGSREPQAATDPSVAQKRGHNYRLLFALGLFVLLVWSLSRPSGRTPVDATVDTKSIEVVPSQEGIDLLRGESVEGLEVSGFNKIDGDLEPGERQSSPTRAIFKKAQISEIKMDRLASFRTKSPPQVTIRYDPQASVMQVMTQSLQSTLIVDVDSAASTRRKGVAFHGTRTVELSGPALSLIITLTRNHPYQISGGHSVSVQGVSFLAPEAIEPAYSVLSGQVTIADGSPIALRPSEKLILQNADSCTLRSLDVSVAGKSMKASLYGEFLSVSLERPGALGDTSWTVLDRYKVSRYWVVVCAAFSAAFFLWELLHKTAAKDNEP